MAQMSTSPITIVVIALYLLMVFVVGIVTGKKTTKTSEDYYTGNRSFGFLSTALSAGATESSSWVFLGSVGFAYVNGILAMWMLPGLIAGNIIAWFIIAPRLRKEAKANGSLSMAEFLGRKTQSKAVFGVATLGIVILFLPYMASNLLGAAKTISALVPINFNFALIFSAVFVLAYCFIGGYRSVILTDSCQAIVMLIVFLVTPIYLLSTLGGWNSTVSTLMDIDPLLFDKAHGAIGAAAFGAVVGKLTYGVTSIGLPQTLQRAIACRSDQDIRKAATIKCCWHGITITGGVLLGLCARVLMPGLEDAEYALPMLANTMLNPVVAGVIVGAIFAAIQSTYSSLILTAVQGAARELPLLFGKKTYTEEQFTKWGRYFMILFALISVGIAMLNFDTIFALVWFVVGGLGSMFGPLLLLLLLKPEAVSRTGAIVGMIAGGATVAVWYFAKLTTYMNECLPGMLVALIVILIVSKIAPNKGEGDYAAVSDIVKNAQ